jgi:hypothetical protein
MIYPKIKRTSRGNLDFQWRSTRSGFRFGSNSFWRWLRYPFTRTAWNSRAIYKSQEACQRSIESGK